VVQVITADDRTGALEAAAQCADAGLTAAVVAAPAVADDVDVTVIDLGSRHLDAAGAAARIGRVAEAVGRSLVLHKIDSTLRGNWVAEIGSLVAGGRRVLLVPAFPAAGRICRDGIVLEHGVPVDRTAHALDARSPSVTSSPASVLPGAVGLGDAASVRRWCPTGGPIGVVDAATDADLDAIVAVLADAGAGTRADIVLVGTAGVAGAWARRLTSHDAARPMVAPVLEVPVVVVCGSAHPASRAQVARLIDRGVPVAAPGDEGDLPGDAPVVIITAPPLGPGAPAHVEMAAALGRAGRATVARLDAATVVVLGGDTAAAMVGDLPVRVQGSLDVGVALGTVELGGRGVTIVTKPGGFGDPGTLEALMRTVLPNVPPSDRRPHTGSDGSAGADA
jgi:D-threonate/D-erythronate kinase